MSIGIILLVILIVGGIFYYNWQKNNRLIAEGKIIKRDASFFHQGEEFTLTVPEMEYVTRRVQALPYSEMKISMKGDSSQQLFRFSGPTFEAQLWRKGSLVEKSVYCFTFNRWKQNHNGATYDIFEMNMLLTAIEKMFLSIDPTTQVRTWDLQVKTKPKFF